MYCNSQNRERILGLSKSLHCRINLTCNLFSKVKDPLILDFKMHCIFSFGFRALFYGLKGNIRKLKFIEKKLKDRRKYVQTLESLSAHVFIVCIYIRSSIYMYFKLSTTW